MSKCVICGKGPQFGNHVSFSQRHVKRRWNINVQKHRLVIDGQVRELRVCANCLKTLTKVRG
jgi:large subunit ribosomal protein L28